MSTKNYAILMKFDTQQHIWNSITVTWPNMKICIIQDGRWTPYWMSFVGNNSAVDCLISVKFSVGKQFTQNFSITVE